MINNSVEKKIGRGEGGEGQVVEEEEEERVVKEGIMSKCELFVTD